MKPENFIIAFIFFLAFPLFSQQNNALRGKMLYLSSGRTPAIGVEISGTIKELETANTVYTTNNGSYILNFPKARDGYRVILVIGNEDQDGNEIEIVNEREANICRIPADASEEFEIIVCKKGARDIAAQKYYKIIKTSSGVSLSNIKEEMDGLLAQKKKDYQLIAEYGDKISKLEQQTDSITMYREALHIASINKDNASKRVLRYIQFLDEGKSITEAREALNIKGAAVELDQSLTLFLSAIEELEMRAGASASIFDYDDAITCYDTIIAYSERMGIDPLKIAQHLLVSAEIFFDDGKYGEALEQQEKVIAISEEILDVNHPELAEAYTSIGMTYLALGQLDTALVFQQKSVNIYEEILETNHPDLAQAFINIGNTYIYLGQYEYALELIHKAVVIREEVIGPKSLDLAEAYDILGMTYHYLADYEQAIEYVEKALVIREEILSSNHPLLAESYNNIGQIYQVMRQHGKALDYQLKGVGINEEILDSNHLKLAISYNNLSITYQNSGNSEKALDYQQKAIKIQEEILEPNHPELATSYNNLGLIYQFLGQFEMALDYHQKCIAIQIEMYNPEHPSLAITYLNIGTSYRNLGKYKDALDNLQKAVDVMEESLGQHHPNLASAYYHIGLTYTYLHHQKENVILYLEKSQDIFKENDHPDQHAVAALLARTKAHEAYGHQNYQLALDNFLLLIPENESSDIWNTIGTCYEKLSDYPQAIEAYQRALAISPEIKTNYYYNNIGVVFAKNNQFEQANNAFKEFEKLFPDDGRVFRNWAMYYALRDEKDKAIVKLKKAIKLGYDDLNWLETDGSMRSIREDKIYIGIIKN